MATGALEGGEPLWPSEIRYLVHAAGSQITGPFPAGRYDLASPALRERAARELKQWLVASADRGSGRTPCVSCGAAPARSDVSFATG